MIRQYVGESLFYIYFFPLQSLANAFISSFYFYVNIVNMHTKIFALNIGF